MNWFKKHILGIKEDESVILQKKFFKDITPATAAWENAYKEYIDLYQINMRRGEMMMQIGGTYEDAVKMMISGHVEEYEHKFEDLDEEETRINVTYRLEGYGHLYKHYRIFYTDIHKYLKKYSLPNNDKIEWDQAAFESSFMGIAIYAGKHLGMGKSVMDYIK